MGKIKQSKGRKGSLKWIQQVVNEKPDEDGKRGTGLNLGVSFFICLGNPYNIPQFIGLYSQEVTAEFMKFR